MSHDHTNEIKENRFVIALALTGLIFLAEFIGGFWTHSLALLSDRHTSLWMPSPLG